jgi:hypothetical protein
MLCRTAEKRYGGSVLKDTNGKLLSIIEVMGADVLIVQEERKQLKKQTNKIDLNN